MRAVVQRVSRASVTVDGQTEGSVGPGLLVLLAVQEDDGPDDLAFLKRKICRLRVFDDAQGRMNLSVRDVGGSVLVVSQFTLLGDCRKGNRPSFTEAAPPEQAMRWYERFLAELRAEGITVASGRFQASMKVSLVNEGPVTLILDSRWKRGEVSAGTSSG